VKDGVAKLLHIFIFISTAINSLQIYIFVPQN